MALNIRNPHSNIWTEWHVGEPTPGFDYLSEIAIFQADGDELKKVLSALSLPAEKPTEQSPLYRVTWSRLEGDIRRKRRAMVRARSQAEALNQTAIMLTKVGFELSEIEISKMHAEEVSA